VETLGIILIGLALTLLGLAGVYVAAPVFLRQTMPGSRPRIRIKSENLIDPARAPSLLPLREARDAGAQARLATASPRPAGELFSEIMAIREGINEMASQIAALRESMETTGSRPGRAVRRGTNRPGGTAANAA